MARHCRVVVETAFWEEGMVDGDALQLLSFNTHAHFAIN
jgi:hypothetical protein